MTKKNKRTLGFFICLLIGSLFLIHTAKTGAEEVSSSTTTPPSEKNDPVFQDAIQTSSPMTPEEIIQYRHYLMEKQKATFDVKPPRFNQPQDVVKLHPGALPPLVRLAAGYSGAVYFTDMSGAAWPVTEAKISSRAFTLEHPKTKAGNTLILTSNRNFRSADLLVFLKGLDFPIAIRILGDPLNADMKTHMIVPRLGPNPILPDISGRESLSGGIVSVDEERFLAGIPPKTAVRISASETGILSVWGFNGKYFIRTQYTLTSPAYISRTRGDGGINLYEIPPSPVIILSVGGKEKMISLRDSRVGFLHE